MAMHDERFAVLETTVNQHSLTFTDLKDSMLHMEHRMDTRFDRLDDRFARLDDKVSRTFNWLVGLQVTILLAVIGSLFSIVAILAPR
jgi:hypothetical protein